MVSFTHFSSRLFWVNSIKSRAETPLYHPPEADKSPGATPVKQEQEGFTGQAWQAGADENSLSNRRNLQMIAD